MISRRGDGWRVLRVPALAALLAASGGGGAQAAGAAATSAWVARGERGMVASDSAEASEAGAQILRAGGNAVDAAVVTSLALGVTRPYSTGLGGGGFFMVRLGSTGAVYVLDCRERAPGKATADMFAVARKRDPDRAPPSRFGGLAVAVPGLAAGYSELLKRFGTRPLHELVVPAQRLAVDGFTVDKNYRGAIRGTLADIADHPGLADRVTVLRRSMLFGGEVPAVGTQVRRPGLARTLTTLGRDGTDAVYRGAISEAIVRTVQQDGGILTLDHLARYRPTWREPLRLTYRDRFEMLLMPPPSSGGVCIAEALNILEHWDLKAIRAEDPGRAAHLMIEAFKHAFADRARYLGDADFAPVPVERLTSKAYADKLAARIREDATGEPTRYGEGGEATVPSDDAGTSHYCVADRWGNIVCATETINTTFGSLLMVESYGIVLNNEMDDFTAEPGKVNAYGLKQSEANTVAPNKRPLSSMSPTIVLEDGEPILALGASGGPRIITATFQVMLNVIESGMTAAEAVSSPRLHHQWQPDVVYRNRYPADDAVVAGLERRGHAMSDKRRGGIVQLLRIGDRGYVGVSDPRKGGRPAGW